MSRKLSRILSIILSICMLSGDLGSIAVYAAGDGHEVNTEADAGNGEEASVPEEDNGGEAALEEEAGAGEEAAPAVPRRRNHHREGIARRWSRQSGSTSRYRRLRRRQPIAGLPRR